MCPVPVTPLLYTAKAVDVTFARTKAPFGLPCLFYALRSTFLRVLADTQCAKTEYKTSRFAQRAQMLRLKTLRVFFIALYTKQRPILYKKGD